MKHAFTVMAVGVLLGGAGVAATAQPGSTIAVQTSPGKATAVQVKETTATVESVDLKSRQVMLRDAAGREHALAVGPDVRNLEQVKKGDRVQVQYAESLSLKLVKNGKELPSRTDTTDGARAPAGAKPGGIVAEQIKVTADVIAVNTDARTVTLRGPKRTVDLEVNDPAQLALIKVGDQIDAVYTQAVAVSVKPAAAGK
jgi:Cu/Ag efflux protein CusF